MNIDIRTLAFIIGLTGILQVIAIYLQYLLNKTYRGIGWWLLWSASSAAGLLCLLLRDIVPVGLISASIFLSNILLLAGQIFLYIGIMRFLDKKENRGIIVAVFTVFIISTFYVLYVNKDDNARTLILYAAAAIFAFLAAQGLFVNKARSFTASANFISAVLFAYGCYFALRALAAVTVSHVDSVFTPTLIQIATFLVMLTSGFLCTLGLIIMVSQRSTAEMREAKEQFELIFNTGPDATLITRPKDGLIVNINEGFTALTGYTRDETVGKSSLAINLWKDPADRQNVVDELGKVGFCDNYEAVFRLKDGSQIDGTMSAKIITLQGVQHIISVTRDITERKRAEGALQDRQEMLNSLLNSITESALLIKADGTVLAANASTTNRLGNLRTDISGLNVYTLLPVDIAESRKKMVEQAIITGQAVQFDDVRLGRYFQNSIYPIASRGGLIDRLAIFGIDLTERKQAEEDLHRLAEVVRHSSELVNLATTEGKMVFINDSGARMLGINPENIDQFDIMQAIPDHLKEKVQSEILPMLQEGGTWAGDLQYINLKTGLLTDVHAMVFLIKDTATGAPLYMANVSLDITERKRMEEKLKKAFEELERYTYTISHDLKSPLVTIKTFLGYLKQDMPGADADKLEKDMLFIESAADKMSRLLDELLEMSRIGRVVNPPVTVTFGELVQEALDLMAGGIRERGVAVQISAEPLILQGDRPRLVEIWQNLLENAVKFMGQQESPRIDIGVERIGSDTVFLVRDNGMGIEPRYKSRVFNLFDKLDAKAEGTGLGLAIVRRIVELYKGTVWFESAGAGQGSCFFFTLPAALQDESQGGTV